MKKSVGLLSLGMWVLVCCMQTACSLGYAYRSVLKTPVAAREEKCAYEVIVKNPTLELKSYVKLGVYDNFKMGAPDKPERLKQILRDHPCEVGAEALLVDTNDIGEYTRVTAVKWNQ